MNPDTIEQYYQKYQTRIYLYAYSLCKQKEVAEDLTSETFYRAFLTLGEENKSVKYWLLSVCRNLWIDLLRKNKQVDDKPVEEWSFSDPEDIPQKILLLERDQQLYLEIYRLPLHYQEVLILHYFMGLSLGEISKITGKTPASMKMLLHRARMRLKKRLEATSYEF